MTKKYNLLKREKIIFEGRTLYRIKALKDFRIVKKGDLGGFVESEENLSHEGNCWIYHNAKVMDNAIVRDNAEVMDNAIVRDNAIIQDYATIKNNAEIVDEARVTGNARVKDIAKIEENALIKDQALVGGNAIIEGNTIVKDQALVKGNAHISGDVIIGEEQRIITGYIDQHYDTIRYELAKQLGITTSGNTIRLFKKVCKIKKGEYASVYDPLFIYEDGKTVKVENPDKSNKSCSSGIHCSTPFYWSDGDTIIEVEVKLKDIITVQDGKVRAKKVKVIGEVNFSKKP